MLLHSTQYKNGCLAASDHFHKFTQSIKFYITFNSKIFEKFDSSDSKNEWLLLSASFQAKFRLVFVLTLKKAFY